MSGISRDEWLKALTDASALSTDDPSAVTSAEFATMCGFSQDTAQRRLRKLLQMKRVLQVSKRVPDTTGRLQRVVAYKLLEM